MFLIETHMHTSEASACGNSSGQEMARKYKEMGYDAIIITDHFFNGNSCIDRKLSWHDKVSAFTEGYNSAKAEGDKIGIKVFFGFEYNHRGAEFLVYKITPEFLLEHPEIMTNDIVEFFDLIHNAGGFICQAHPYREAPYLYMIRLYPNYIDAVEAFNGGNAKARCNLLANFFADTYGLPKTAGSDLHDANSFRGSGMAFDEEINSIDDYVRLISKHKGKPIFWGDISNFSKIPGD